MTHADKRPVAATWTQWTMAIVVLGLAMTSAGGCKRNPRVVPVAGKVLYNGQPLPFGSVMFQPDKGQPAMADIAADGSFTLSSYGPNDGAVPGKHAVSVSCYEGQRPGKAGGGDSLGKLLIPLKYTRFGSSGLSADVPDTAGEQPQQIVLELTGPAVTIK
jgi:hypothetical protein